MKRTTVLAKEGDTLATIGKRYDVSPTTMERVNRKSRKATLKPGETVVLYVPNTAFAPNAATATAASDPVPNGPVPLPPVPDLLP